MVMNINYYHTAHSKKILCILRPHFADQSIKIIKLFEPLIELWVDYMSLANDLI